MTILSFSKTAHHRFVQVLQSATLEFSSYASYSREQKPIDYKIEGVTQQREQIEIESIGVSMSRQSTTLNQASSG